MSLFSHFLLAACFLKCVSGYASGIYDCPAPWIGFNENCYKFVLFTAPINVARSTCATDGAFLVAVRSRDENDFVVGWLQANARQGLPFFTGGYRTQTGSTTFYWEPDGSEITGEEFWFSDRVRNLTGNRIVYYTDGANWGWSLFDDSAPNAALPYICQINKANIYQIVNFNRGFDYGINELDITMIPRGPRFTKQPVNNIYDPMSAITTVLMDCEADGNPVPTYQWYVRRALATTPVNMSDPRITVTNGLLAINKPSDTVNNGDYQCAASNPLGSILSTQVQLSFGYLNDFPKSQRTPVVATAYTGVGIECNPPKSGYNALSYAWFKDQPKNFIRPNVKWYIFVSSDSKLYFQSVTKDDAGDYFCIVTRPNSMANFQEGKVSMPIPLRVIETVGSEQEPQIVNSFPKAFPSSPQVGDDVRVECVAWGTDILTYSWSRLDAPMPTNANFTDYSRVLLLPNIQMQQAGTYRCTVNRRLGQSTYGDMGLSVESAPFFTIPLPDQQIDLGANVSWICMANGNPDLTYRWYVNASALDVNKMLPADKIRFTVSNNQLFIINVQPQDAGMYQCSAENTHGARYSSAQLRVLSFAPSFAKFPLQQNQYGTLNGNVTLFCNPESSPPASKTWYQNGSPLATGSDSSAHYWQLPNGNLHISQLSQSDAGNYTCTAQNINGQASSTGQLTILASMYLSQPPRDMTVIVNGTAFFSCGASYNPAVDVTYEWFHNAYLIMFIKIRNLGNGVAVFTEDYFHRGYGVNRGGLYIRQAQFFHRGVYRCVVVSTTDQIEASAILNVNGPPGQPAGVTGYDTMTTNISLSWWPCVDNGRPLTGYIVEAFSNLDSNWTQVVTNVPPSQDFSTRVSTVVQGLNPYTSYKFRVKGVNSIGVGEPSQESSWYRTLPAPPKIYPKNLGGGGGKVGTLNITWDPIPLAEWNADPGTVGYIVSWKRWDMDEDQWDSKNITDLNAFHYVVTIGANIVYTEYHVTIQVYNPSGLGPRSPRETIRSAEDLPKGVPINVRAVYFNATAITVEWQPVADTIEVMRGRLLGYRINYWVDVEEDETMALFKIIRNQTDHGLIIALRPNTYYMINVQAINTAGNGPKSENYRTRTLRHAPIEAPQDVRVSPIDSQSVLVRWRGVYTTIIEEPLEGYIVRYWERGQDLRVGINLDAGKAIQFVVSGLMQNIQYELRVFGVSRGGDGLQSSPTTEFILGTGCVVQQDSPDKDYVYLCSRSSLTKASLRIALIVQLLLIVLNARWRMI